MRLTFGDLTKEVNVFNLGRQPYDIIDEPFEINLIEDMTTEHKEEITLESKGNEELESSDLNLDEIAFHTPFWDRGVDNNDSEISLKFWKLDRVKFLIKVIHLYIIFVGYIREVSGGFLRTPHKLDWAAFRGPIRPPTEPPP